MLIFNRERKRKQFARASRKFSESDFLFQEVAERLISNFGLYIVKKFDNCLNIGDRNFVLLDKIKQNPNIEKTITTNLCKGFLARNPEQSICCDEEFLPFEKESFDLILSNLALHWINDLPGFLFQSKNILKKNGFFSATIFGGKTLFELQQSFINAGNEKNKFSPRISPFADCRDMAGLMQRAGFYEPVAFSEEITVKYENLTELLHDIRNMGETNAVIKSSKEFPGKNFFKDTEDFYRKNHNDNSGYINATFEVITFSGWKR